MRRKGWFELTQREMVYLFTKLFRILQYSNTFKSGARCMDGQKVFAFQYFTLISFTAHVSVSKVLSVGQTRRRKRVGWRKL